MQYPKRLNNKDYVLLVLVAIIMMVAGAIHSKKKQLEKAKPTKEITLPPLRVIDP